MSVEQNLSTALPRAHRDDSSGPAPVRDRRRGDRALLAGEVHGRLHDSRGSFEQRSRESLAFTDQYRAYVINYGLGRDMVAAYIEAQGEDQATRWAAMERILSEPTLPSQLAPIRR